MTINFVTDRLGYPAARADKPWVAVSSMLESELQGDFSINGYLRDLRATLADGSKVEFSGNAHTLVAVGGMVEVVCDFDPQIPPSRLSTKELIELILAWQKFRASGTPMQWSPGTGERPVTAQHPP